MSIAHDELESFHQFAEQRLKSGGPQSLDELFDLWRIEHPSDEEQADVHAAIREGLDDIEAGRFRPAADVMTELRAKYNVPRQ